ncbi:unnamed protein product [Somion occarium]|uniref:Brain protein I3 n=1 Tax=Somion occarium TaxID=3059160 RepID=A0ABP1DGC2_9APHY
MIVKGDDSDFNKMVTQNDGLPTYDMATGQPSSSGPYVLESTAQAKDVKVPVPPQYAPPPSPGGPSRPPLHMPPTRVYNYVNPNTHEHVASLLPPDHPQMVCLQEGRHVRETRFGLLGILAAVFWFPLGIGLCLLDRRVKCKRCGLVIDEGFCY